MVDTWCGNSMWWINNKLNRMWLQIDYKLIKKILVIKSIKICKFSLMFKPNDVIKLTIWKEVH
jgi:hypothetical protein